MMSKRANDFQTWAASYDGDAVAARERNLDAAWRVDEFVTAFLRFPHPDDQIAALRGWVTYIGAQARWRASMDYDKLTGRADYKRQAEAARKAAEALRLFGKIAKREGRPVTHDFFDRVTEDDFLAPEREFEALLADCSKAVESLDTFIDGFDFIEKGTNSDRLAWWFVKGLTDMWDNMAIDTVWGNAAFRDRFAMAAWQDLDFPVPVNRGRGGNDLEWIRDRFDAFREFATQFSATSSPPR